MTTQASSSAGAGRPFWKEPMVWLVWGLPLALLACVKTALGDGWRAFGTWGVPAVRGAGWPGLLMDTAQACLPAGAALGLLWHGLGLLGRYQRQERVWMSAVERARLLNLLVLAR